jgi:hypothetical protein
MVSIGYYWSFANLGLLVMAAIDSLLLIAFIVCAVTLGKPMSFLNCYVIDKASYEVDAASAYAFVQSTRQNLNTMGSGLDLSHWAGATKSNCFQAKTIMGLSIALWYVLFTFPCCRMDANWCSSILFTTSTVLLPTLWYKNKKATPAPKTVEDA